jgi:hypothetical protein
MNIIYILKRNSCSICEEKASNWAPNHTDGSKHGKVEQKVLL